RYAYRVWCASKGHVGTIATAPQTRAMILLRAGSRRALSRRESSKRAGVHNTMTGVPHVLRDTAMQVARQLLSLSNWNLQDADAYVAVMEIRRSFVLVVSQQPVPGTIGPENSAVGTKRKCAVCPLRTLAEGFFRGRELRPKFYTGRSSITIETAIPPWSYAKGRDMRRVAGKERGRTCALL